jgi:hypothetical protein
MPTTAQASKLGSLMFGVPGLDPLGLVHALFGLTALVLGLSVILGRKGTRLHRRLGRDYLLAMVLLNATALAIYDLYGRFGPFHWAALGSLATLGAGFVPVFLRRAPRQLDEPAWDVHVMVICGPRCCVLVRDRRSGPRHRLWAFSHGGDGSDRDGWRDSDP